TGYDVSPAAVDLLRHRHRVVREAAADAVRPPVRDEFQCTFKPGRVVPVAPATLTKFVGIGRGRQPKQYRGHRRCQRRLARLVGSDEDVDAALKLHDRFRLKPTETAQLKTLPRDAHDKLPSSAASPHRSAFANSFF